MELMYKNGQQVMLIKSATKTRLGKRGRKRQPAASTATTEELEADQQAEQPSSCPTPVPGPEQPISPQLIRLEVNGRALAIVERPLVSPNPPQEQMSRRQQQLVKRFTRSFRAADESERR